MPSLLSEMQRALRLRHYSERTEGAYTAWVRRFVRFSGMRHPRELGPTDVTRFLSSLAVERHVAASTQNQALSALLFLYKDVLDLPVGWLSALVRAKKSPRVPVVFTKEEVRRVLAKVKDRGSPALVMGMLYGTGMRLMEVLRLRVKDIDFGRNEIVARGGKGDRDRVTMLPDRLKSPLLDHLAEVRAQHEHDVAGAGGWVELPGALDAKYPNAAESGAGSGCFRQRGCMRIWPPASDAGIIFTRPWCSGLSRRR
jgi:integrase